MVYTCPRAQKKHLILTLALFVIVGYEQSNYKVLMVVNDKNTIKAGGSTAFQQNVDWVSGWSGWYPLDCYDY